MKHTLLKTAAANALMTALYVALISAFMFYIPQSLESSGEDNVFIPIFMLLLFVFSAALTGMFVFGKPIMWYLDGKKKEAMSLLAYTLLFIFILALIVFLAYILLAIA